MNTLEKFKQNNKPGQSKLSVFHENIESLFNDGYTVKQIHEYLKQENVSINYQVLCRYVRVHLKKDKAPDNPENAPEDKNEPAPKKEENFAEYMERKQKEEAEALAELHKRNRENSMPPPWLRK
ncbi:hypothetical protein [Brackiella oedipodis]|uniref:hypothetical protein n=1 Tax=Brackiella oedipodis TaxID=124225 RepID=UPI00048E5A58|nr:hypothetical protein [Brackiella oedipodis]